MINKKLDKIILEDNYKKIKKLKLYAKIKINNFVAMLKNVPKNGLIMEKIYTPLLNIFQPR
jgi:hypothetical protein